MFDEFDGYIVDRDHYVKDIIKLALHLSRQGVVEILILSCFICSTYIRRLGWVVSYTAKITN